MQRGKGGGQNLPALTNIAKYSVFCLYIIWVSLLHGFTIFGKKEFEIVWGKPPYGPLKILKIFRRYPTWPPITQYLYFRITKYYKNKDVCKKLELKILSFGQMADIFVRTKISEFLALLDSETSAWWGLGWIELKQGSKYKGPCQVYCRAMAGSLERPRRVLDPMRVDLCVPRVPWSHFCCIECKNIADI